jgi:ribose/xylose/arabinose/galactoside ABC-type transport system permease subunit
MSEKDRRRGLLLGFCQMTSHIAHNPKLASVSHRMPKMRNASVNLATLTVAIILTIVLSLVVPEFLQPRNLINILNQLSVLGFMAIGMTYVMVAGGIDLSMYTIVSAAAVVGATLMVAGFSPFVGCTAMILVSLGFGLINGLAISIGRMTPFIVTLSTMVLAQGFAVWFTSSQSISGLPDSYVDAMSGRLSGVLPVPVLIVAAVAIVAGLVLAKTKYGRWVYLAGVNEAAARISGIPTRFAIFSTYMLSASLAGITAIVLTAKIGTATTAMLRDDSLLDVVATTVIGGASLTGGSGSVFGTMLGLIFIITLGNAFNLLGVSPFTAMAVKGLVLIAIVGLDTLRSQR